MRVLESERLIIKPIEEEDLEYLLNLRWDGTIMNYLLHDPISMKDQKKWFDNLSKNNLAMSVFLKNDKGDNKIIGTSGLYKIDHRHQRAVTKVRIDPAYQRMGFASEVRIMILDYGFNTLNLRKITADCFLENEAIVNLNLKLGFKKEGVFREQYYHNGRFRDAVQFGILKEEFLEKREEWFSKIASFSKR